MAGFFKILAIATMSAAALGQATSQPATLLPEPSRTREQLERDLQEMLTNVELVGSYRMTTDLKGRQPLGPASSEKYTIVAAAPDADGYWIFTARVQYGEHDVQLPMRLKVVWAGDTPIVTVDQVTFPGLGTYSARVMFYNGYYSGTWFGANCGGVLAGEIRKIRAPGDTAASAPAKP